MDDVIRDLAREHGYDNVPDDIVHEVKRKLSTSYIDDILDTGKEIDVSEHAVG